MPSGFIRMADSDDSRPGRLDLAQDRTDLAEDRTVLAHERSFAGWVRTGMASVGIRQVGPQVSFGR